MAPADSHLIFAVVVVFHAARCSRGHSMPVFVTISNIYTTYNILCCFARLCIGIACLAWQLAHGHKCNTCMQYVLIYSAFRP